MKKIFLIGLIVLAVTILASGCAYYPAKTEVKSLNNLSIESENLVFKVVVDKADETKISEKALKEIQGLILKSFFGTDEGVQKAFAEEVANVLEKIVKNQ